MPVLATYPGVYIQEIPSGVHTITGVATSVTAIIVRLYNPETGANATPASSKVKVGGFQFVAASKGAWGSNLRASIDTGVSADVAAQLGLTSADLFNLTITEVDASGATVSREIFRNLTVKDSARRVDNVLLAQST